MWEKEYQTLDMAEIYRQNYEDALDEIRNLKYRIAELEEKEKKEKREQSENAAWDPGKPLTIDEAYYYYK